MENDKEYLIDTFLNSAKKYNRRNALFVKGKYITYEKLLCSAKNITSLLINNLHDSKNPQCALYSARTKTTYSSILGILLSGMAYVPLNPKFPDIRNMHILTLSEASVLIVDSENSEKVFSLISKLKKSITILFPDLIELPKWTKSLPLHTYVVSEKNKYGRGIRKWSSKNAYIIFTSGTTGKPKGVPVSNQNILQYIKNVYNRYTPTEYDKFTQLFDITFDLSVHDLFLCWRSGACLYVIPPTELLAPDEFIRKYQITFWFSVPSAIGFLKKFKRLKKNVFPSLKYSLFCGEALPSSLASEWQDAAPNSIIENLYGPTEATVAFTAYRYDKNKLDDYTTVPIGKPLDNQSILIVNEDFTETQNLTSGELLLSGTQVTSGYWNNQAISLEKFIKLPRQDINKLYSNYWYRTGDLVYLDKNRNLIYVGRIDDQIKIRGYRVEVQEIEFHILKISGADMIAVIPWPIDKSGQALGIVCFVMNPRKSTNKIINYCHEHLPEYMVPHEIYSISSMPLNANGKIDRNKLKTNLDKM